MIRRGPFVGVVLGVAALCAQSLLTNSSRDLAVVVYNPTDSVPQGWYTIERGVDARSLPVGSIVLARLPADVAAVAAYRGYLPKGVPILKRVGAVSPQFVCVRGDAVHVNGRAIATVLARDGVQRPLEAWAECRRLVAGELFLLSVTSQASFDSRYFGPLSAPMVLGSARPLWTWEAP